MLPVTLRVVFSFLFGEDIAASSRVCGLWHSVSQAEALWKSVLANETRWSSSPSVRFVFNVVAHARIR